MSSIFSRPPREKNQEKNRHRRSSSVAAPQRYTDRRREPTIDFSDIDDVSTHVGTTLAEAILRDPSIQTGKFFETSSRSRRDLLKADAVILISAAIMGHLGNSRMEENILNRSATCSKYYSQLGLENSNTRTVFVTLLFSMNPFFSDIVEKSIIMALNRASNMKEDVYSKRKMAEAMSSMFISGTITSNDIKSISSSLESSPKSASSGSIQKTPVDMIMPSDSVTHIGRSTQKQRAINQEDLMDYSMRKRSGKEPEFHEVFRSAAKPIKVDVRKPYDKSGLGASKRSEQAEMFNQAEDAILGSTKPRRQKMENIPAHRSRHQSPTQDYYNAVAGSVYNRPPDSSSNIWDAIDVRAERQTARYKRDSPVRVVQPAEEVVDDNVSLDSFEELMNNIKG
jgi:hypothetical protein